jgi:hypothetical protein
MRSVIGTNPVTRAAAAFLQHRQRGDILAECAVDV